MKSKYIIAVFFLITIPLKFTTAGDHDTKDCSIPDTTANFEFNYPANEPWKKITDYSQKDANLFGKEIAQQLCMIDHRYIIFSQSENDYRPDIIKPTIYGSLLKLKNHYKTLLKKGLIEPEEAKTELGMFLIKGYVCYAEDTGTLEELLSEAETFEDIVKVMDRITLK